MKAEEAIEDFIEKNEIDWLVMIPRKHSFFEGLFHKSHSKAIARRVRIPLVALHETVVV
jgi:nucleotide-binding universal stress UspA family protein